MLLCLKSDQTKGGEKHNETIDAQSMRSEFQ